MPQWLRDNPQLYWLAGITIVTFIGGAIAARLAVIKLPADYFSKSRKKPTHSPALKIGKNILGYTLVVAGIAMLILPGPGAIAILAGIALADFPGKHPALRWILTRGTILKSMNTLRRRHQKPPFKLD